MHLRHPVLTRLDLDLSLTKFCHAEAYPEIPSLLEFSLHRQKLTDTEFNECLSRLVSQTRIEMPLSLYVCMMIRTPEVNKYIVVTVFIMI